MMNDGFNDLAGRLSRATSPEDIFDNLSGSQDDQIRLVNTMFRHLVPVVHPDKYQGSRDKLPLAQEAFVRLSQFKTEAEEKIRAGIYGNRTASVPKREPLTDPIHIQVRKRRFTVGKLLFHGDLCDLYACTYSTEVEAKAVKKKEPLSAWERLGAPGPNDAKSFSPEETALFKIAQNANDNDLVERESKVLTHLYPQGQPDEKFYRYLPRLIDSFNVKGTSGPNRRANVLPYHEDFVSLADVLRAYPKGIDYRDMVWMFKRLLAGLGFVHSKDVVHCAVIPTHVLIHPVEHGAKIIDWSYASMDPKAFVPAMSAAYKAYYAPEIPRKIPPKTSTDIFMAAKCAVALLGGNIETNRMPDAVPEPIRLFIQSCLIHSPGQRPNDAWALHEEFDELLGKIVGKPRYRPFHMPAK